MWMYPGALQSDVFYEERGKIRERVQKLTWNETHGHTHPRWVPLLISFYLMYSKIIWLFWTLANKQQIIQPSKTQIKVNWDKSLLCCSMWTHHYTANGNVALCLVDVVANRQLFATTFAISLYDNILCLEWINTDFWIKSQSFEQQDVHSNVHFSSVKDNIPCTKFGLSGSRN